MALARAGKDRSGKWHIINPDEHACEMGHKLRNWDKSYPTEEARGGLTELHRRLQNRPSKYSADICSECNWRP